MVAIRAGLLGRTHVVDNVGDDAMLARGGQAQGQGGRVRPGRAGQQRAPGPVAHGLAPGQGPP